MPIGAPAPAPFPYDKEGVRAGHYTDAYFLNAAAILDRLVVDQYHHVGSFPVLPTGSGAAGTAAIGPMQTEMHFFTRRKPWSLACGVNHSLQVLKECAGGVNRPRRVSIGKILEVEAVPEGTRVKPWAPALVVRGEYRRYGYLETVLLGVLTRETKIATNVYRALQAARGKPIFFFPARFDLPAAQRLDGYSYRLAVERYNADAGRRVQPYVSTQAQAELWGGQASGTVPHAYLLCFLRDTAEAMVQFARTLPITVKRIALVDVNNDSVTDAVRAASALFEEHQRRIRAGDREGAERYRLFAVRADTADDVVDRSLGKGGEPGVSPELIRVLRRALDEAPDRLGYRGEERDRALRYFRSIQIAATGGFDEERIRRFERLRVPVDMYGVGSAFLQGKNDYTADVLRAKVEGKWVRMAKVGRRPRRNPDLQHVRFA
ncbi:MAG: nicotinate phosphoribosyltransferase [Candidatus Eisenbacteria bacterium]